MSTDQQQQQQQSENFMCKHHPYEAISRLCRRQECNKSAFICTRCVMEGGLHDGHPFIQIPRFRESLLKFVSHNRSKDDLSKDGSQSYTKMSSFLEETQASIYKQSQKLTKLSQFMENLNETLLSLQEVGEETDLAYNILINVDKREEGVTLKMLNEYLNQFLLLIEITPDNDEPKLKSSSVSNIRIKNVLDKKAEFTASLRKTVDEHDKHFERFVKEMGQLIKDHKQFLVAKTYESEEARLAEFGKRAIYNAYYKQPTDGDVKKKGKTGKGGKIKNEDDEPCFAQREFQIGVVEKCGNVRLDTGILPQGIKKQMLKLCNYLIFYNTLMCDWILPEPILKGVPIKKMQSGEFRFPIRCSFCRLLRVRNFVQFYFRFDLVSRFGKLCVFKDKDNREIAAHEMCLLWANKVNVDLNTMVVDVSSLIAAVQFAQAQICKYCGSIGAALKCNKAECTIYYHFNCLKQVRLMGLQLDHEGKFRFFCEDHVRQNYQGQSDWFITRIRMKHIIQQGGQPAFTKKHQQIDWSLHDGGRQQQENNDADKKRRRNGL